MNRFIKQLDGANTAVSIFVVILVELTNTVFVNIETTVLSICKVKPGPRKKTKTAADAKIAHVHMLLKMNRRSSKSRGGSEEIFQLILAENQFLGRRSHSTPVDHCPSMRRRLIQSPSHTHTYLWLTTKYETLCHTSCRKNHGMIKIVMSNFRQIETNH